MFAVAPVLQEADLSIEAASASSRTHRVAKFWDNVYSLSDHNLWGRANLEDASDARTSGHSGEKVDAVNLSVGGAAECIIEPHVAVPAVLAAIQRLPHRPDSILEVGCGESALAELLYDGFDGRVTVTATDISQVALANAAQRSTATGPRPRLRFVCADATDLSAFGDASVAVVIEKSLSDSMHLRGKTKESKSLVTKFFEEVARVLRPGGMFIVLTPKARVRLVRGVCRWSDVGRELLMTASGALLMRHQPDAPVYLHYFVKSTGLAHGDLLPAPPEHGSPHQLFRSSSVCDRCGIQRLPRYRSDHSWNKHRTFCQ